MNLYDFSQNNNIEVGVLTETNNRIISGLSSFVGTGDLDSDAFNYFQDVIVNSELLYLNTPYFESQMFGLSKKYTYSTVEIDLIENYHDATAEPLVGYKFYEKKIQVRDHVNIQPSKGYCIRTGISITFNIEKPYCDKAYNSWVKWSNEGYQEKYCHFSGELSDGNTCFSTPILKKHWREAKRIHQL